MVWIRANDCYAVIVMRISNNDGVDSGGCLDHVLLLSGITAYPKIKQIPISINSGFFFNLQVGQNLPFVNKNWYLM